MASLNFYPRPPRGGRPESCGLFLFILIISIHVLREEDDSVTKVHVFRNFISIHVLREEDDCEACHNKMHPEISIHVLREEDDVTIRYLQIGVEAFLSTSSARRTTGFVQIQRIAVGISIHVLREEDDSKCDGK